MSYTPTTEEVREIYRGCLVQTDTNIYSFVDEAQADAEFDRWLAKVKARVWDEGWISCHDCEANAEIVARPNPYRQENHAPDIN